ncbi:hypothetical protein [Reyranella sp.]|uniref:hypothetical protein n=1 Tax=Reyranella sp. TaxID=1929291 RepID=UPI003C7D996C
MKRRIFMAVGAAAGLLGASASARANAIWVTVSGSDNRYRLKMPLGYRYLQVPTHSGTVNSYVYMQPDKLTLELVDVVLATHNQIPTGAALTKALEEAQGGMMKSWPGSTVQEQRQIETGPLTGREFVLSVPGNRFVRARLYLTADAVYSQVAQGPAAELGSALVVQFFESLRFG